MSDADIESPNEGLDKETQRRLALAMVERSHVVMWMCDEDLRIVMWNRAAEEEYGFTEEEALGQLYYDLFVDDTEKEDSIRDTIKVLKHNKRFSNFLAFDVDASGNQRNMLTNSFRIVDPQTRRRYNVEIGVEISDLELRRNEHRTLRELGVARKALERESVEKRRQAILGEVNRAMQQARSSLQQRQQEVERFRNSDLADSGTRQDAAERLLREQNRVADKLIARLREVRNLLDGASTLQALDRVASDFDELDADVETFHA